MCGSLCCSEYFTLSLFRWLTVEHTVTSGCIDESDNFHAQYKCEQQNILAHTHTHPPKKEPQHICLPY